LLDGNFHAKLCDFGLAIGDAAPLKDVFVGGTDAYMAPEMLLAEGYSTPADVFSLGLVMASMLALSPIGEPYTADVPVALTPTLIDELGSDASSGEEGGDDRNEEQSSSTGLGVVLEVSAPPVGESGNSGSGSNETGNGSAQQTPLSPILVRSPRSFFEADAAEIRAACLPGCPEAFLELCLACCASDPNDRPQATDLAASLEAVLADLDAAESEEQDEAPATAAPDAEAAGSSSTTSGSKSANLPPWCPPPSPPTPLETALPIVARELTRWQKRFQLHDGRQPISPNEEEILAAAAAVESNADEKVAGLKEGQETSMSVETQTLVPTPIPFDNSELADTTKEDPALVPSLNEASVDTGAAATSNDEAATEWAAGDAITTNTFAAGRASRRFSLPAGGVAGGMAAGINQSNNRVAGAGQRPAPSPRSSSAVLPPRPQALPPKPSTASPPPTVQGGLPPPPLLSGPPLGGYALPPRPPDPSTQTGAAAAAAAAAANANAEADSEAAAAAAATAELNREMDEEEAVQSAAAGAARQTLVAKLAEQVGYINPALQLKQYLLRVQICHTPFIRVLPQCDTLFRIDWRPGEDAGGSMRRSQ